MNDGLMYDEAIWLADELTYTEMSQDVHITNSELNPLYRTWHDWLCNHDGEDTGMEQLRKMVQRVSQRLNQMNWKLFLPVTDDFVVFPADGSHTFYDDIGDLLSSITPAQESMLRSRNMIREE